MARYTGRQLPGLPSAGSTGGFLNFTKQLIARRSVARPAPKKIEPVKPSLITTKQKEAEIQKTLSTKWMPSGLHLAKLRQLAAQKKILDQKSARDFLHKSAAGTKLGTRESLQKFETELLAAELAVTTGAVNSPIKYKLRQGGAEHLNQKAKMLVKELYQDAATNAQAQTESPQLNAMQERQARLATLHASIHPPTPPPGQTSAPAVSHHPGATPTLQAVAPLTSSVSAPRTGSPLVAPPSGLGSHIPGAHDEIGDSAVSIGMPVVTRHEPTAAVISPAPGGEAVAPVEPVSLQPKSFDPEPPSPKVSVGEPLPPHPNVPTESASGSSISGTAESQPGGG